MKKIIKLNELKSTGTLRRLKIKIKPFPLIISAKKHTANNFYFSTCAIN